MKKIGIILATLVIAAALVVAAVAGSLSYNKDITVSDFPMQRIPESISIPVSPEDRPNVEEITVTPSSPYWRFNPDKTTNTACLLLRLNQAEIVYDATTGEMLGGQVRLEPPLGRPRPGPTPTPTPEEEPEPNIGNLDYYLAKSTVDQHAYIVGSYVCWNFAEDLAYDLDVKDGYARAHPFFVTYGDGTAHVINIISESGYMDLIEPQNDNHVYSQHDLNNDNLIRFWIDTHTSRVDCLDQKIYWYGGYYNACTEGNRIYCEDDDYIADTSHRPTGSSNDGGGGGGGGGGGPPGRP